jgi:hypothetical protein
MIVGYDDARAAYCLVPFWLTDERTRRFGRIRRTSIPWHQLEPELIPIARLRTSHLVNIIAFLRRNARAHLLNLVMVGCSTPWPSWANVLKSGEVIDLDALGRKLAGAADFAFHHDPDGRPLPSAEVHEQRMHGVVFAALTGTGHEETSLANLLDDYTDMKVDDDDVCAVVFAPVGWSYLVEEAKKRGCFIPCAESHDRCHPFTGAPHYVGPYRVVNGKRHKQRKQQRRAVALWRAMRGDSLDVALTTPKLLRRPRNNHDFRRWRSSPLGGDVPFSSEDMK